VSELWVPEAAFAADERAVARALRDYDDELRLVPQPSAHGLRYEVRRWRGTDKPAEFLLAWIDEQLEPLPLSMKLLELVKQHDRNTRSRVLDENVRDELRRQAIERSWDDDVEAAVGDWLMPHGRPVLPRSVSLRQARDRRRARGEKA
jgi:hypothetical protein